MTAEQITAISTALTSAVNGVLDTFIDLLPIIALTVVVSFGIRFVNGRFNAVRKGK